MNKIDYKKRICEDINDIAWKYTYGPFDNFHLYYRVIDMISNTNYFIANERIKHTILDECNAQTKDA